MSCWALSHTRADLPPRYGLAGQCGCSCLVLGVIQVLDLWGKALEAGWLLGEAYPSSLRNQELLLV